MGVRETQRDLQRRRVQDRRRRTSDWRVSHVAALQAGLNAVLALKLSHEVNYRNEPVPGFTRADTVAAAAIVASF